MLYSFLRGNYKKNKMKNTITRESLILIKKELINKGEKLNPNSRIIREYKNSLTGLSKEQIEAAIGHLLGDARIESRKNGKRHLLKFEYGEINKDYLFNTYKLFENYCLSYPREQKRINVLGNMNTTWCFQTLLHPDFNSLGELFLNNNKIKQAPLNLFKNGEISALSLARWFIDDGGMYGSHSRSIQLHTQSFTLEEVQIMVDGLNKKFNLSCRIGLNKGKPVIILPARSYDIFTELVNPYMHSSMMRKLRMR